MKLYDSGVYLVNGRDIVEEGQMSQPVSKEEAKKNTIAYHILESHNTSGNMEKLQIKFDKLTSHDITFVESFRLPELPAWKSSRCPMC